MIQRNTYPIQCPQCKAQQDEELYDSIDVAEDPALRSKLLENQINAVTCEKCKHQFRIDKNLLYTDPKHAFMVYLFPSPVENHRDAEENFERVLEDLQAALPPDQDMPQVELVLTRVELVEAIFMRESGLDRRAAEYVKYMIYTQNLDQLMPENKALLFNAEDTDDENLVFVVQDLETQKLESVLQYKREGYDMVLEILEQDPENSLVAQLFPGAYVSARAYLMDEEV